LEVPDALLAVLEESKVTVEFLATNPLPLVSMSHKSKSEKPSSALDDSGLLVAILLPFRG
jgi:hypothetical protein